MKIAVSFINSYYDLNKTLELIDASNADYIHVDIMDGRYVQDNNFDVNLFPILAKCHKPLDVHLMVKEPEKYLPYFQDLNVDCITVHPSEVKDFMKFKLDLAQEGIKLGIAINPSEDIDYFEQFLPHANKALIMSVYPGKGGQIFMESVLYKIKQLQGYNLEIGIDGGINAETIKLVEGVDYVVSGSFVCCSDDFNRQIAILKNN